MKTTNSLKILTYNIHKGFSSGNQRFILPAIKAALSKLDADIICLQEIQGEHSKHAKKVADWPSEPQLEFLAENLWPHSVYGKNAIYKKGHHGNAILSKFPLIAWENIDISNQQRASRSILHGIMQVPTIAKPLHIICIHLGLFKYERTAQLVRLNQRIDSHVPHDEPLIIAGDFNDWRSHAADYLESHLNLREIFTELTGDHAKTFPAWRPTLQVDRIYYRGLSPVLCKQFNALPWKNLSDHLPLFAEFRF